MITSHSDAARQSLSLTRAAGRAKSTISWHNLRTRPSAVVGRILLYLVIILGASVFALPLLWMVRTSVMPTWQVYLVPPQWIPAELTWEHWLRPFEVLRLGNLFRNNLTIAAGHLIGTLISCSIVAFGFARLRFWGRNFWFVVLLSTMMLPDQVTLIPLYILFSRFGWINTYNPLIVPAFFGSAFYIFLLRQFYMTLPLELDDAARIDGCSAFGIFWRILLPLSAPALGVIAIMDFTATWDWFMAPLLYLWDAEKFNLPLGLLMFFEGGRGEGRVEIEPLMATTLMAIAPILVIFFLAQRYFIQGIVITGVEN